MTPQLIALLTADVALFVIAFAVLRLYQPRRMAPALIVKPTMIRIPADVVHYDMNVPGTGVRIHKALKEGYYFLAGAENVVTYKRDEMFVPAGQW